MNYLQLLSYVAAALAFATAIGTVFRKPRSLPQWCFSAGMTVLAVESLLNGLTLRALPAERLLTQQGRLAAMSALPGIWYLFSITYSRGNSREFARRWLLVIVGAFVLPLALVAIFPQDLYAGSYEAIFGPAWLMDLDRAGWVLHLLCLGFGLLVLLNLEHTFRNSVGTMRWRIKYVILGVGLLFAARLYSWSQILLYSGINPSLLAVDAGALIGACLLIGRSLPRQGTFSADVYPSQKLLSNSFILAIIGIYLLVVGVIAKAARFLGGDGFLAFGSFFFFVALAGLAVLLLSDRCREYAKRFISRHLRRPRFDYRQVWLTFIHHTTSKIDRPEFCRSVARWISDTFNVLSVTVWIVDETEKRLGFGGSTSLLEAEAIGSAASETDISPVFDALRNQRQPMDLDQSPEPWAGPLKRICHGQFPEGGSRVCVPLVDGGNLIGIILLCDRVSGVPYSTEDFELLRCVSDQVAGGLKNIRLSEGLIRARELEAFQAMSAFFVHDLKNVASSLSLMLQNLPTHFDNPAFREDALRGVSKNVTHINDLIGRLSQLRQGLELRPQMASLNEIVSAVLSSCARPKGTTVQLDLQLESSVLLDPGQIQKVVTNLLLNAFDATSRNGEICLATTRRNGWAVLAVSDNGGGISPEFLAQSLFRPFQTTKKQGIGIGLYHCKTIVEAHRGRIEVESQPGKGTTFSVLLPMTEKTP